MISSNRRSPSLPELSEFADINGFHIDGVSLRTAYLPDGWRARLIPVAVTANVGVVGLCLEPHDLCATKMARNEDKDREFVGALIDSGLVNPRLIRNRLDQISDDRLEPARAKAARRFIIAAEVRLRERH